MDCVNSKTIKGTIHVAALAICLAAGTPAPARSATIINVRTLCATQANQPLALRAAEVYRSAGHLLKARELLSKVLAGKEPEKKSTKTCAIAVLEAILDADASRIARRQIDAALLQRANDLLDRGEVKEALSLIDSVLKRTPDVTGPVSDLAEAIASSGPSLAGDAQDGWIRFASWWSSSLPVIAVLAGVGAVILLIRLIRGCVVRKDATKPSKDLHWRFIEFDDQTNLGIGEDVAQRLASLTKGQPEIPTVGLLQLEILRLPEVGVTAEAPLSIDWSSVLADAPTIRGVSPKFLVAIAFALRQLACPPFKPTISGSARRENNTVWIRLTARRPTKPPMTVVAETVSLDRKNVISIVEEVTFMMHFLIAHDSSKRNVLAAEQLRAGLAKLDEYTINRQHESLMEATNAFGQVRLRNPDDMVAILYEGVARDLGEQHDRAFALFHQVATQSTDEALRNRATYNQAISKLRQYKVETLTEAENTLRQLVLTEPTKPPGIILFARAALANVIAHKLIFWRRCEPVRPESEDALAGWREKKRRQVSHWTREVDTILTDVRNALDADTKLEDSAKPQLFWSVENARGNRLLYWASRYLSSDDCLEQNREKLKEEALEQAEAAFRQCEVMLPAGVETLTNLATVLLERGKYEKVIDYTKRARELNPRYEYAYYREAQAIQKNEGPEACKAFLEHAKQKLSRIEIPAFRDLYQAMQITIA